MFGSSITRYYQIRLESLQESKLDTLTIRTLIIRDTKKEHVDPQDHKVCPVMHNYTANEASCTWLHG